MRFLSALLFLGFWLSLIGTGLTVAAAVSVVGTAAKSTMQATELIGYVQAMAQITIAFGVGSLACRPWPKQ